MTRSEMQRPPIKGLDAVYGKIDPKNKERVAERIKFGDMLIRLEDPNGYLEQVSDHVDSGAALVTFSNHTQHYNAVGFIRSYRERRRRNKNGFLGAAYSLVNTGQRESVIRFAQGLALNVEDDSVWLVPFARDQDLYDYKRKFGPGKAKEVIKETRENIKFVEEQIARGDSEFMYFPEDTTTGGTRKHWWFGKHRGMVEVKNDMALRLIEAAVYANREIVFSGLSMIDFDKIVPPRRALPSMRAMFEIVRYKIHSRLGKDFQMKSLARVVVEKPITIEDLIGASILQFDNANISGEPKIVFPKDRAERHKLSQRINTYLMKSLSSLPDDLKGVYK